VIAVAALATSLAIGLLVTPHRDDRLTRVASGARDDALARLRARVTGLPIGPWAQRQRMRTQTRQVQALTALAAELRAGQAPGSALMQAAGSPSAWPVAERVARAGGDVAAALRSDAAGREPLVSLAVCWQAALRHGVGLADAVDRLAASSRDSLEIRASLAAELAGPRATARVLTMLPVIGVVLGIAMGADPLRWLLGTRGGWACLIGGAGLTALGSLWTSRIAARVEAGL